MRNRLKIPQAATGFKDTVYKLEYKKGKTSVARLKEIVKNLETLGASSKISEFKKLKNLVTGS